MGSVVKADRIDEILWKRHRRTIERLYVQEQRKLKKEDGVIEYMKKHHGFIARYVHRCVTNVQALIVGSKSQYELHFKKWRLRKNLTKAEWRKIIRFMKERAVRSEHIEVRFNRTVLSKERLDREIARYGSVKEGHNGPHEGLLTFKALRLSLNNRRPLRSPRRRHNTPIVERPDLRHFKCSYRAGSSSKSPNCHHSIHD